MYLHLIIKFYKGDIAASRDSTKLDKSLALQWWQHQQGAASGLKSPIKEGEVKEGVVRETAVKVGVVQGEERLAKGGAMRGQKEGVVVEASCSSHCFAYGYWAVRGSQYTEQCKSPYDAICLSCFDMPSILPRLYWQQHRDTTPTRLRDHYTIRTTHAVCH